MPKHPDDMSPGEIRLEVGQILILGYLSVKQMPSDEAAHASVIQKSAIDYEEATHQAHVLNCG